LIWAENIRPGKFCVPAGRRGKATNFVKFEADSTGITRSNAIVIQRTTNNSQKRRIIAARVSPSEIKKHGGFTTENHTIVLTGPNPKTLSLLVWLLNSKAVDDRYRQVSGTASVSVTLLREIDLPSPQALAEAVERFGHTDEAISAAYKALSLNRAAVVA
jgi:adenine-specific DNA-methyltransferase